MEILVKVELSLNPELAAFVKSLCTAQVSQTPETPVVAMVQEAPAAAPEKKRRTAAKKETPATELEVSDEDGLDDPDELGGTGAPTVDEIRTLIAQRVQDPRRDATAIRRAAKSELNKLGVKQIADLDEAGRTQLFDVIHAL